jgi:hypothetical protein
LGDFYTKAHYGVEAAYWSFFTPEEVAAAAAIVKAKPWFLLSDIVCGEQKRPTSLASE